MMIVSKAIFEIPVEKRVIKVSNVALARQEETNKARGKDGPLVGVILPTYNERENISLLIPVIEETFDQHGIHGHIIVVDDNSKDGTAKVAFKMAKIYRNISVIQRPGKLGLGSAYRIGFKHALSLGMDVVMEMDADLSHRPSYIPLLLKCLEKYKAGLVIGSRYCENGGTRDWPFFRKLISHLANFFTRFALGVHHTKDITSGFRAYDARVLEKIEYQNLETNGYAWQIETLYKTKKTGAIIKEIPIIFHERELGVSKLGIDDVKEFISFLVRGLLQRIRDYFLKI